ncbi:hypothetical protein KC361_g172 [Hortaea werneckii]|nr:hypothetical protein KC361_g172 [Hortaea werneckii]
MIGWDECVLGHRWASSQSTIVVEVLPTCVPVSWAELQRSQSTWVRSVDVWDFLVPSILLPRTELSREERRRLGRLSQATTFSSASIARRALHK